MLVSLPFIGRAIMGGDLHSFIRVSNSISCAFHEDDGSNQGSNDVWFVFRVYCLFVVTEVCVKLNLLG